MIKYMRYLFQASGTLLTRYPKIKKMAKKPNDYTLEEKWNYIQDFFKRVNDKTFHQVFFIKGQENLPKGQCLFVCNHTSNMDPISLFTIFDRPIGFLAKKEVKKMPLIGYICQASFGTFLDREDLRSELKTFINIESILKNNKDLSYVVFPEGHRSKGPDFNLQSFHAGTFKLATRREIPIVPICIYLPERVLNQKYHYKKYPIQIRFLKPFYPDQYENLDTKEIATIVRNQMITNLEEMKKDDRKLVALLNNYSEKKLNKVFLINYKK